MHDDDTSDLIAIERMNSKSDEFKAIAQSQQRK